MSKIYFIADSHLAYLLYANRPSINMDNYRALFSVVRYIIEDNEKNKAVIFCGDNLDKKAPGPSDLKALQDAVGMLNKEDIPVYGIEGNHDKVAARKMSVEYADCQWIDLVPGMKSINNKTIDIHGIKVHGMDYIQGRQVFDKLEALEECDVLVMHQPFAHVSPFEANTLEIEGVPDQVNKAVVYGHVHVSDKKKTSSGKWVVSPGSTHAQKITHPHGSFAVYDVESNEFEFVRTPDHREMLRFKCVDEESINNLEGYLEGLESTEEDNIPIIGIKYDEESGKSVAKLIDKYNDKAHFFPKIMPSDREQVTAEEVKDLSTEDTLIKLFESMELDTDKDSDLYKCSLSLIEGNKDFVFKHLSKLEDIRDEIIKDKTG